MCNPFFPSIFIFFIKSICTKNGTNTGLVVFTFGKQKSFLQQLKIEPNGEYFKTCSNKDILLRILRNLETSYAAENNTSKLELVSQLVAILFSNKEA